MLRDRLPEAIALREDGRAKQDEAILKEARALLLELSAAYPDDAEITFQTAVVHDNLGMEQDSVPLYVRALEQGLSGPDLERACLAWAAPIADWASMRRRRRRCAGVCASFRRIAPFRSSSR